MILRDYYNNQFGNNFYLFINFVKDYEKTPYFESFLLRLVEDMKISCEDLNAPLYDYLYKSIFTYTQSGSKAQYNFSFLYEFLDKDFLNLFLSKEGEELTLDNNIYDKNFSAISIEKESFISRQKYTDLDLRLEITKDENYSYLDKYKDLSGFKYIKNEIILSKIRKYIQLDGILSFFLDADEESLVFRMFQIIQNGTFCEDDINNFFANKTYVENLFNYEYD